METIEIYIYGASGHGKVVYDVALRLGYKIKGFVDDDRSKKKLLDLPVLTFNDLVCKGFDIALGIGDNKVRHKIYNKLKSKNITLVSLIDPSAIISKHIVIGEGSVIFPNSVVNNSATIGKGCIINTGAIVEHDCVVGDFAHISPNAALAGGVKVGKFSQVGIGACVKQNITIGENVIIGAGAVVLKDVPDNVVVVGNPGRVIRKNE